MSTFPINTIVVLVQENRSFDHMLGWMKTLKPEINGVTGTEFNYISANDATSEKLYFGNKSEHVDPDPGHSIQDIYEQVFGMQWEASTASKDNVPEMKGFAQNAERLTKGMSSTVMNGFQPDSVPIYKELVSEFAVFDRWFASVPASTQPNRLFVHSATSNGAERNDTVKLILGFPQKTIFESLDEAGLSFGIYYQNPPSTLFYRSLDSNPKLTLPDPQKTRPREADENGKLSEFQEELVQMAATLNGDCYKDTYPDKLVKNMTCAEGCKYVEDAFKKFRENCENAKKNGTDDSEIVLPFGQQNVELAEKRIACLACNII
ncbi:hypothetical protein C5167_012668 [Papaver somniferum]|uniref:Phosphoesterase n=1 Tax=Papaver somniferum TaxID=3469 RepID=A0A4Y7J1I0_PAPSO|nr:hypothetical protein C5167_012668 [Papaver somniferum]